MTDISQINNREQAKAALERTAALEINTGDVDVTIVLALELLAKAWEQGHRAYGGESNPFEQTKVEPEYEPPYPIREVFARCRNCGGEFHAHACGPGHALIDHQITLTRFNIKFEVRRAHSGWTCFFETQGIGFTGSGMYFQTEEQALVAGREEWANRLAHAVKQHEVRTAERLLDELEDL